MNTKIQQLSANFTLPLARQILLSKDITPAGRDQIYNLAKKLGKLDSSIVKCSLAVYARNGDVRKVEQLIARAVEVDGVKPHPDFQCSLARAHAVKGDIPASLKILNSIPDSSIDVFTFPPLASTLGRHPDGLEWCLRVFDTLKRFSRGQILGSSYNTLINKVGINGDLKKMEELFEEMEKNGVEVNEGTFICMIDAHVKNFNMDKAVELLEESKRRGIPHFKSYNTILDGYVTMKDNTRAARWKEKMDNDGYKPNDHTASMQLRSLIHQRKMNEALRLVEEAESKGEQPDVVTYTTLINGFVKSNDMEKALKMKDHMENKGVQADATTYNSIIDGYCKRGDMEQAQQVLAKMEKRGITVGVVTFNTLIAGHCNRGDMEQAKEVLDEMERRKLHSDALTCNTLIKGYCTKGDMDQAHNMLDIMEKWSILPDDITYNTLINGYCKKGDMDQAKHTLDMMEKKNIIPNVFTFNTLIGGYCEQGKMDKAMEMKEEMTRRGIQPDTVTLKVLRKKRCHQAQT